MEYIIRLMMKKRRSTTIELAKKEEIDPKPNILNIRTNFSPSISKRCRIYTYSTTLKEKVFENEI